MSGARAKMKSSRERAAESKDREQVSLSYFAGWGAEDIFSPGSLFGVKPQRNVLLVVTTQPQCLLLRTSHRCANSITRLPG